MENPPSNQTEEGTKRGIVKQGKVKYTEGGRHGSHRKRDIALISTILALLVSPHKNRKDEHTWQVVEERKGNKQRGS